MKIGMRRGLGSSMKVIIAGSRSITDYSVVAEAVEKSGFEITEVVSGCAGGVDRLGEKWAKNHKIPIKKFPAQWSKYGKSAGYVRNGAMARYADALIAVWDGVSRGTKHMMDLAKKEGVKFYIAVKGDV